MPCDAATRQTRTGRRARQSAERDPNARVDVESLKKLATFMHEKLQWLDKPVNVDSMVDQGFLPR